MKYFCYIHFYIPSSYTVPLRCQGFHFCLDLHTIGRTPWTSDRPVARPLPKYRTTQTQNKCTHAHAHAHTHTHTPNIFIVNGIRAHHPSVRAREDSSCLRPLGYRDRLASEWAKTVHALDRSATVTGFVVLKSINMTAKHWRWLFTEMETSIYWVEPFPILHGKHLRSTHIFL
jgi:hypothetical protein